MENIGAYSKAIVAAIMAALLVLETFTGWKSEFITEQGVITVLAVLTPVLVYFIPNRTAD
ncbi:MAG: hypothetical protein C5B60_07405 [Chloroflexi bacterium]|nr:MAG: hypothetical protein C5B60_07405 [Chloroflexota bacterium]